MLNLAKAWRVAVVCVGVGWVSEAAAQTSGYAGSLTCAECHDVEWNNFKKSIHFQTDTSEKWEAMGCEACHGPGEEHVDSAGDTPMIFGSNDLFTAQQKMDQCLSCHAERESTHLFRSADHPTGAIDCSSCHQSHEATPRDNLLEVVETAREDTLVYQAGHEACLRCHQEVRASTNLVSRHRIQEGMVKCGDCHEQHGPSRRSRLAGFQQETCVKCHIDKQGPFVYEHLAGRIEGCTSCHVPHGSPNRHMLQFQAVADQCYSCHVVVPGFHKGFPGAPVRFDATSVCTNCHSTIHGSNLDPYFLR